MPKTMLPPDPEALDTLQALTNEAATALGLRRARRAGLINSAACRALIRRARARGIVPAPQVLANTAPSPALVAAIRQAREAAGLGPRQAAKKLHVAPVYLAHLEAGAFEPPVDVLKRMARAYGAPDLATWFEKEHVDG